MKTNPYEQAYHDTPVREFHEAFGHPISYDPRQAPEMKQRILRMQMLASELVETARAMCVRITIDSEADDNEDKCVLSVASEKYTEYDPIEAADGLADLRYIVDGGNLICGFPGEVVLAEVHRSNMSKLGPDGKAIKREDGKTIKGPNYFKPNIRLAIGMDSTPAAV